MLKEHGHEETVRGEREAERRVREMKLEIDRKLTRDKMGYRESLAKICLRKKVMISPMVPPETLMR